MENRQDEFRFEGVTNLAGGDLSAVQAASGDPARLETLYQNALASGAAQGFAAAIESAYSEEPGNVLYGAWHYRFVSAPAIVTPAPARAWDRKASERAVWQWRLAIPLSVLLAVLFWISAAPGLTLGVENAPVFILIAPPLAASILIAFLALGAREHYVRAAVFIAVLIALTVYTVLISPLHSAGNAETYQYLALLHLPVVAWGLVGLSVLGLSFSATSAFAFLTKSIEAIGTGGVFAIAGGIFVVLTVGLFQTLNINLDETVTRLLLAGGAGLIPLIAVSAVYDTAIPPERQEFGRGFGKILAVLMQALLALSLIVMLIYILTIPLNFSQPFVNRDTLIIYNVVLLGVMGVLLGATPFAGNDLSPAMQRLVRAGIILLAVTVVGVSAYALAAVLYRTAQDTLTMNRLTIIGWNVINIAVLILLLVQQSLAGRTRWIEALHGTFRWAAISYLVWALFVLVASPLIF
jgi:hypothetical protein